MPARSWSWRRTSGRRTSPSMPKPEPGWLTMACISTASSGDRCRWSRGPSCVACPTPARSRRRWTDCSSRTCCGGRCIAAISSGIGRKSTAWRCSTCVIPTFRTTRFATSLTTRCGFMPRRETSRWSDRRGMRSPCDVRTAPRTGTRGVDCESHVRAPCLVVSALSWSIWRRLAGSCTNSGCPITGRIRRCTSGSSTARLPGWLAGRTTGVATWCIWPEWRI